MSKKIELIPEFSKEIIDRLFVWISSFSKGIVLSSEETWQNTYNIEGKRVSIIDYQFNYAGSQFYNLQRITKNILNKKIKINSEKSSNQKLEINSDLLTHLLFFLASNYQPKVVTKYADLKSKSASKTIEEIIISFVSKFPELSNLTYQQFSTMKPTISQNFVVDVSINNSPELFTPSSNIKQQSPYYAILKDKKWWFYAYGYNRRLLENVEKGWVLLRIIIEFNISSDGRIKVKLNNIESDEHFSYSGEVDFTRSNGTILVVNFTNDHYKNRHLHLIIDIGKGKGEIFLGQYINVDNNRSIISGSVLLQNIPDTATLEQRQPAALSIPDEERYLEDIDGVSSFILEYFKDENQHFRRTPTNFGYDLKGFSEVVSQNERKN
ncbi:hypothetical protein [Emticicia fontis]